MAGPEGLPLPDHLPDAGRGGRTLSLPFLAQLHFEGGEEETVPIGPVSAGPDGALVAVGKSPRFEGRLFVGPPVPGPGVAHRSLRLGLLATGSSRLRASVRVECRLGPSDDPGWLVPGLFYGDNRRPDCERLYPRFCTDRPEPSRLESGSWAFRADRAATPVVFAWDRTGGAALATAETSDLGESGLGFALENGSPVLRLHFPFREEPVSYDGSSVPLPPVIAMATFAPGTPVELAFSLHLVGPDRHAYAPVLRHLHAEGRRAAHGGASARAPVAWVGVEEAAALAAWGLYRWHYRPAPAVLLETAAFDREALGDKGDRPAMHVSWVSGVPYAYALLRHARRVGHDAYLEAALRVLDHVAANLAPGGTFWGQWDRARGWTVGWTPERDRLHSRTLADATLFLLRALASEKAWGAEHRAWEEAARSNLAVVSASQRDDGALAAAYAASDGRALDWRGSAGLAWVAPLAEAAVAFSAPEHLAVARRAGAYFASFVDEEFLCGAPEDVDLAPTSEDGYLAVMSYMALSRAEADPRWLRLATRAADWMLTFRYSYDVSFPGHTLLGHYRFRTAGADQASPANQHLHAFGLICLPEMAELSRALGDGYYRERARETLACFRQFIAREDGDFDAYRGMASERYYQTSCFQAKGMLLTLSHAWSVGVLLLACEDAIASGAWWEEGSSGGPARQGRPRGRGQPG